MQGGAQICDFIPVEGLHLTIRGKAGSFDLEWRDARCLPCSSDAEVSRNVTPRVFAEGTRNVEGLIKLLRKIVFNESGTEDKSNPSSAGAAMASKLAQLEAGSRGAFLHLQHRTTRARMQRVAIAWDQDGTLVDAAFYEGSTVVTRESNTPGFLQRLAQMCSPEQGWTFMRPVVWSELPSELWWPILKCLTVREGRAVSCSCSMIHNLVNLSSFYWAPAQVHLALVTAQEAVRSDTSTRLPLNIVDKEIRIGRSRRNDVVLLRDPEVSKKHCKLWRDSRGDVYIEDLSSTNGTKLNGEWLRPQKDLVDRRASAPRKLVVGDQVVLGLTTLALNDGPCPNPPAEAQRSDDSNARAGDESPISGGVN
mmetsp:Transcript_33778/g.52585  ORF Transcript_33778/g.52585 Transcript_33778/m.52585 type:complete len:365 (-) Transcript_33778:932-2026(-)